MPAGSADRCYVVTLNWNSWRDTLVCLESVLRLELEDFVVVLCDNASTDGSTDRIRAWARGDLDVLDDTPVPVRSLAFPPVNKPVRLLELDRTSALKPGALEIPNRAIVLIHTGANDGCAKGLNVGLRFCLTQPDFAWAWLLNHDTIVDPNALTHLLTLARSRPEIGIAGSTVRFAFAPGVTQALGGATFNLWSATGCPIGFCWPAERQADGSWVEQRLCYVAGTSMLVTRPFLERVGLIPEHFFLYFEEIAWAMEARGRFRLGYAPESIVYHREGGATGSSTDDPAYGGFADRLILRNRLVFTRLYAPWALFTVTLGLLFVLVESIALGRWTRARLLLSPRFWSGAVTGRSA